MILETPGLTPKSQSEVMSGCFRTCKHLVTSKL